MRKHDIFTHENNMLFSHVKVSPLLCSLVKYSSTREEKLRISSGHVISSMYPFMSMNYFKVHYIHVHYNINFCFISAKT